MLLEELHSICLQCFSRAVKDHPSSASCYERLQIDHLPEKVLAASQKIGLHNHLYSIRAQHERELQERGSLRPQDRSDWFANLDRCLAKGVSGQIECRQAI